MFAFAASIKALQYSLIVILLQITVRTGQVGCQHGGTGERVGTSELEFIEQQVQGRIVDFYTTSGSYTEILVPLESYMFIEFKI